MKRRSVLATGGSIGATILAGCSSDDDPEEQVGSEVTDDDNESENGNGEPREKLEPASFMISSVDYDGDVTYDGSFEADAEIVNEGEENGDDSITLEFGNTVVHEEDVEADGSESNIVTVSIDAGEYDGGDYPFRITTTDDSYENTISIERTPDPAKFEISDVSSPDEVGHDESFDVELEVINTGELTGETKVDFTINGSSVDEHHIESEEGETEGVSFTITEDLLEDGRHVLEFETEDDTYSTELVVVNPNPWKKDTLVVGLEQEVPARHDIHQIITDALDYWDENAESFVEYPIAFDFHANSDDPDIEITIVEDIDRCGVHTGAIAGCAPLVTDFAPETADVRVVDGYRSDWMTTIVKHEIGHTLGLDHDDEPSHIMSDDMDDRIPNFSDRMEALEWYSEISGYYSDGNSGWNEGTDAWSDGDFSGAESGFVDAHNNWLDGTAIVGAVEDAVGDLDEPEALDLLAETYLYLETLRLAADSAIDMAREAQRGNYSNSSDHREESNEYLEESDNYELHDTEDFVRALGIPYRD